MITTASKLMLAQDEIEDLRKELISERLQYSRLEAKYIDLRKECFDTKEALSILNKDYSNLFKKYENVLYDLNNPWWKFW